MINTFFSVPVLHCHKLTEQGVERSLTVRHVTRLVGVPTIAVLSFDFCAHSHTWICRMREKKPEMCLHWSCWFIIGWLLCHPYQQRGFWEHNSHQGPYSGPMSPPIVEEKCMLYKRDAALCFFYSPVTWNKSGQCLLTTKFSMTKSLAIFWMDFSSANAFFSAVGKPNRR